MTAPDRPAAPSLPRRLTAMLYDSLLVVALVMVVVAIALAVVVQVSAGEQQVVNGPLVLILVALSVVGFFTLFWLKDGQTLGMQAWRIKLVRQDGGPPSLGNILLRCLGAALSAACLGLGYLWCLVDRNGRYWHDYLSGTELILLPRREKKEKS